MLALLQRPGRAMVLIPAIPVIQVVQVQLLRVTQAQAQAQFIQAIQCRLQEHLYNPQPPVHYHSQVTRLYHQHRATTH